jgi:hypothetical protein
VYVFVALIPLQSLIVSTLTGNIIRQVCLFSCRELCSNLCQYITFVSVLLISFAKMFLFFMKYAVLLQNPQDQSCPLRNKIVMLVILSSRSKDMTQCRSRHYFLVALDS